LKVDLELIGGLRTNRRSRLCTPLAWKKIPTHANLKKTREEDAGRRVFSEAFEEDVALTPSDVHPAGSIGLPERCPHSNRLSVGDSNSWSVIDGFLIAGAQCH
jgi:hypothetical protein